MFPSVEQSMDIPHKCKLKIDLITKRNKKAFITVYSFFDQPSSQLIDVIVGFTTKLKAVKKAAFWG